MHTIMAIEAIISQCIESKLRQDLKNFFFFTMFSKEKHLMHLQDASFLVPT